MTIFPRRSAQSLLLSTAIVGSGLALIGGQTAKAQNPFNSSTAALVNNTNRQNAEAADSSGSCSARCQEMVDDYYKRQAANKPATVNQYVTKAQAVFATDANGNYAGARTQRVQSIIDNVVKLYNQAGPTFEHTPGLYAPMREYFNRLKPGQEQDIALMVVNELTPETLSVHNTFPVGSGSLKKGLVGDYAAYLAKAASEGYPTIADRFRSGVLRQTPTNNTTDAIEAVRITFASMLNVPYQPRQTLATARSPNGQ